uniref:Uncharacterized protein n=1 Tax=Timema genevievae TaxID=629358 RepID=A0A7R9JZZ4_TIMGE|nr:unnamed protein product [Timema genevievae]
MTLTFDLASWSLAKCLCGACDLLDACMSSVRLHLKPMIDTLPVTMWRIVVVCLMVLPLANSYLEHCQKLPDWSIEGKTLIPSGSVTVVAVLDAS